MVLKIGPKAIATKRQRKRRGQYLGGKPMFGFTHDADRKLVPDPAQQRELRRIQRLHAEGLSPDKVSADLAERGVTLSCATIRKIIAGRSPAGTS